MRNPTYSRSNIHIPTSNVNERTGAPHGTIMSMKPHDTPICEFFCR
jgi:hypothetical protein